ncbi:unnamed protein product [Protopolystoma xenopodis]|uniref:Uncharacterized protein n=1 Tax=Protopolystoma xenopodis TaxID=117903 RepID=A0A3S5BIK7_9PLAT|nr:unnamed protein product [Protopolystoma xenopodis]
MAGMHIENRVYATLLNGCSDAAFSFGSWRDPHPALEGVTCFICFICFITTVRPPDPSE